MIDKDGFYDPFSTRMGMGLTPAKPTLANFENTKTIWVTFTREGIHRYPEAGTNPALADVSFLQYPHRHTFHFKVEVDVSHDNREIEFIQFKRWLEGMYDDKVLDLDYKSCEMMAQEITTKVFEKYQTVKWCRVTVSEDGENGATVTQKKYYGFPTLQGSYNV